MEQSPEIADLAAAMAKAQACVEGATKGKVNPAFKSKYADLGAVWDACREALTTNGLSVMQMPSECESGRVAMTTMLAHSSGQWVRETLSIPLGKVDAQGYGSAITYARRYALAAMVGISPEDDDGNAASRPNGAENSARQSGVVTPAQLKELQGLAHEVGADLKKFCAYMKVGALAELPAAQFEAAKSALEAKRQKVAA